MGKEIECVVHMGLVALSTTRQVDENELYIFITERIKLLLPSVHVAPEPMDEAKSLCFYRWIPNFIVYFYAIVDGDKLRLHLVKCLRLTAATDQQHSNQKKQDVSFYMELILTI